MKSSFGPQLMRWVLRLVTCGSAAAFLNVAQMQNLRTPTSLYDSGLGHDPSARSFRGQHMIRTLASPRRGSLRAASQGIRDEAALVPNANDQGEDGFRQLVEKAVQTLVKSDTDGEELDHSYGSASQGLWLHAPSAKEMQMLLDRMAMKGWRSGLQRLLRFLALGIDRNKDASTQMREGSDASGSNESGRTNQSIYNVSHDFNLSMIDEVDDHHVDNETVLSTQCGSDEQKDGFKTLVRTALQTLIESDVRRGEFSGNSDGSSSQGRWLYDPAAKQLQSVLDRLLVPEIFSANSAIDLQHNHWLRWMKATPSPMFLDLTTHVHELITENHATISPWVTVKHLKFVDMSLDEYVSRIACHIILMPSGSETASLSLVESTGAHIYGKLLYGGVSRFRLLKSGRTVRRVGESREVLAPHNKQLHPSWVQLGGLERKYKSIDMGPAALLELTLLPRLWQDLPTIFNKNILLGDACGDMTLSYSTSGWDPSIMLQLLPTKDVSVDNQTAGEAESNGTSVFQSLDGNERNYALSSHFQRNIGGLEPQIDAIIRRVLDGRNIHGSSGVNKARLEAEELTLLGLQPVRGLLLYGRPGVGKTLIVREIARVLSSRPPKIVAASELLDRWVGGSERLVRELFQDAEEELKMCRMAATSGEKETAFLNSALHVIVVDEIDAVFRKRSDSNDSGSNTRNSVVNQLLAKLDGVNALPNVLMIGMTNRRELLDPALLRPGRLEVQMEIPLPGKSQRREILQIHFGSLRRSSRLSHPLCCAIDGIASGYRGFVPAEANPKQRRKQRALKLAKSFMSNYKPVYDLAEETEGFSGADIQGLVRSAGSMALSRARKEGAGVDSLLVTLDDVKQALIEVKA